LQPLFSDDSLEQAIQLSPNDAKLYADKGAILYELERYKEAYTVYEQAIQSSPYVERDSYIESIYLKKEKALIERAMDLYESGSYEEALTIYEQGIQFNPYNESTYTAKGRTLDKLGRYKEALAVYRAVKPRRPESKTWIYKEEFRY